MHPGVRVHFVPLTQGLVTHASSLNVAGQCCCCQPQMQNTDAVSSLHAQGCVWGSVVQGQLAQGLPYLGNLGLVSHEHLVLRALSLGIPPMVVQGQCSMLVPCQLLS